MKWPKAFGTFVFCTTAACASANAGNLADDIFAMVKIRESKEKITCKSIVLQEDFLGNELFRTEECPVCFPETLEIKKIQQGPGQSRGKIVYHFSCTTTITDFYVKERKKVIERKENGKVEADYIFAFDSLNVFNIKVLGNPVCAKPIVDKLEQASKAK